ncbi:hypothetical protein EDD86DRAFT_177273, partial [Gorgonomyces haynaldii]
MIFRQILPSINFVIGTTALSFQMLVLYPWHNQLDKDFKELEKVQEERLQEFHSLKVSKLEEIDRKLDML